MTDTTRRSRALGTGLLALVLLGALGVGEAQAARRRGIQKQDLPSQEELAAEIEPGRLIYDNSVRRRRLSFESVIKQAMDRNYSQAMLEEIAKQFWAKRYRPVTLVLDPGRAPVVLELDDLKDRFSEGGSGGRPPPTDLGIDSNGGVIDNGGPGGGTPPPFGTDPNRGGTGIGGPGGGRAPVQTPEELQGMARDLENGIHNAVLTTLKEKGYNLVALNVFAQTMDLVKVILILATKDLPDERIRPTLREVRQIIEREVLAARYPGVHLAELSSFTLLNERDNHFYEHPVLYWQLQDQYQGGGGPIVPGRLPGEAPGFGGVATGPVSDYFSSGEFEPEEDFDERTFLGGGIPGM